MAVTEAQVLEKLEQCYDPEIPVNIVDLGLVYDVDVDGDTVQVLMSLTTPGCGLGDQILSGARQKILEIPGVKTAQVTLVWDPPWSQDRITPAGRERLGMV
jgi:metal-sulfur cluster biosynthetic enzyme